MHQVSDGQRRRVQIFLGLIRPFKVLLLDEVTVSLDVVVRQDLLRWLKRESETRKATVLYATHIFDGLDDWPTHLLVRASKPSPLYQAFLIARSVIYRFYCVVLHLQPPSRSPLSPTSIA